MSKIVYLFGAGASAQALPVVNKMPASLNQLINDLLKPEFRRLNFEKFGSIKGLEGISPSDLYNEIISDFRWLLDNMQNHASVDTFAKKLYIKDNFDDLRRLKISLTAFFVIKQLINKPDIRYDTFFASIHDTASKFPDHLRILSWNYDQQFELSYFDYIPTDGINSIQKILNINQRMGNNPYNQGFGIYKLNGGTNIYWDSGRKQRHFVDYQDNDFNVQSFSKILYNYGVVKNDTRANTNLSFAWESEGKDDMIEAVINETEDADVLVVIGYSFPFFNREIDRKILRNMKSLETVYFQDLSPNVLKQRFKAIRQDTLNLIEYDDIGQFLLPNEM